MPANDLHTFFIYSFFGSGFAFLLVLLSVKFFSVRNPKQRMALYLVGLLASLLGYGLYHTVLDKRCQSGALYENFFWRFLDSLCLLGTAALRFLGPVVLFMAFLGLLRGLAGHIYLRRLKGCSKQLRGCQGEWVEEVVSRRCRELNLPRPEVVYTDHPGFAAFVLGIFRPAVVVGVPVLQELTYNDVEGILTHELLHIRRSDTLKGWLLYLVRDIMFFSPASRYFFDRYLLERERLCDAETARLLGTSRSYASTLLKVWRVILDGGQCEPRFSVAFAGKKKDLEKRVLSLMEGQEQKGFPGLGLFTLALTILGLTIIFLGLVC